ncbi:thiamine diphosphokinase [Streptococcus anginosus]|uniref:Thiamine diphosphokinase n=1 Tax=Streptococcus anginosus TaxID=1328 RepID=A0A3S4M2P8_STRAP|nr:thiamine diphosphokinase [Streptococcus anginosus]GAD40067.1 coenzyme metabolism [Streptococcus intermedius SK54 = ATCC 27335]EGL45441.1 thiamine diphosphokinase [Streptococcus anginosus SK52 = DSM 20563]MBZ2157632.1 thiamine diphosphokinase [Streptococcus anginosus]ORE82434.1 thiamine pyrophosphokinase [Streptococcus anginosus SK52 = DSM 20563]UEB01864.1 thiamine diphosphokinase [Streptococcus anginosus subsp. anginosus]
MTKIALFAGGTIDSFQMDFDLFIGVDGGSLFLIEQGICPDLAVGDFDSVSEEELALICSQSKEVLRAQPEKDDTDLELAVKVVFARYPQAQVTIFGAFGGRLDHTLANIFLPSNPEIVPYMQQIRLCNAQNELRYCPQGRHEVKPVAGMNYLAFMPADDGRLTIEGAKYPLNESNYFFKKVYASNEFIDEPVFLECQSGYVIVIYSKDRS